MITTITKQFTFHAAHQLPLHQGLCRNLHGHTYVAEITAGGSIHLAEGPQQGMVMDFDRLKGVWKSIEPLLDHQYLNESLKDRIEWYMGTSSTNSFPPTAEIICQVILRHFEDELNPESLKVRLYETPTSWAECSR